MYQAEHLFRENVLNIVKGIPAGSVLSYGDVAALAGSPRAARVVGGILATLGLPEREIPWWRVVNKQMQISIRGHAADEREQQKELLEAEGWEVDAEYKLKMPGQPPTLFAA
jgi:methylated-DNA-protein-cysteine methyltransferase related protein